MSAPIDHETAVELLPWFVNGTLADEERRAMDRHVRDCLTCRAALKEEKRLAALIRQDAAEPEAVDRNFEKLAHRLDGGGDSRRRMPRAAAAAALLAVVLAGAGAWSVFGGAGGGTGHRTAGEAGGGTVTGAGGGTVAGAGGGTAGGETVDGAGGRAAGDAPARFSTAADPAAGNDARLDVVFADETTEAEITALLEALDATIVGGPSRLGRYTIRFSGRPLDDDERAAMIARLDADERIRFAGGSYIDNEDPPP